MDSSDLFSSSPVQEPPTFRARAVSRPRTPATPATPATPRTPRTPRTPQTPPDETAVDPAMSPGQTTTPARGHAAGAPRAFDAAEAREAALQRELDGVRQINRVIEGVIGTLEQSRGSMKTVSQTVGNASALLDTWTRLLSQTEHNQRLLLDPQWPGATQDLQALEAEALQRQQADERRAAEAERRRVEAARKAEEDERRRLVAASASASGSSSSAARGRGLRSGLRGSRVGRTASTYGTATRGSGIARGGSAARGTGSGAGGTYGSRSGSNIGRGFGTTRGTRPGGRGVR